MRERRIEIRWRDMDAYGHVNNAVYLTYLEQARDEWIQGLLGSVTDTWDFVLAHVEIDYRSELTQDDAEVTVRCGLERVGTSSIRTREEIRKRDGTLSAEASAVIVPREGRAGGSRPLSEQERSLLEADRELPRPGS
ncbi:MAG: acyl-CoA thioesterase [Actinomycetota bacterium]|nr:acyl-CoA thioesterase [Actinomycetota bacterium]